jgi:hypothetical protein
MTMVLTPSPSTSARSVRAFLAAKEGMAFADRALYSLMATFSRPATFRHVADAAAGADKAAFSFPWNSYLLEMLWIALMAAPVALCTQDETSLDRLAVPRRSVPARRSPRQESVSVVSDFQGTRGAAVFGTSRGQHRQVGHDLHRLACLGVFALHVT